MYVYVFVYVYMCVRVCVCVYSYEVIVIISKSVITFSLEYISKQTLKPYSGYISFATIGYHFCPNLKCRPPSYKIQCLTLAVLL